MTILKEELLIPAIAGILGTFIGAFIPSFVQLLNLKISRKDVKREKHELFVRKMLDGYIPLTIELLRELENMDYTLNINFKRNKLVGEMMIETIKSIRDIQHDVYESYPLELRDDISIIFSIDHNLFLYTRFLMDENRYEVVSRYRNLSIEIGDFLDVSKYKLTELEKKIKKDFL